MDFSGQTVEELLARVEAIDREIPDRIKAQVRPIEHQLRRNRQEFETFGERVLRDMEAIRRQIQSQGDAHLRRIAVHNQIIEVMLNMLSQGQAPRAQLPRRARETDRRGPSHRPNQARAPGNQDAESAIRRQRVLSEARHQRNGRVYYRCGVCSKDYQKAQWFFRHLIGHQAQAPAQ